jgi:hypothetical protein
METRIDVGFKGLQLQPGDHVCGFYAGAQQRDSILLPYLRAGLEAGNKPTTIPARISATCSLWESSRGTCSLVQRTSGRSTCEPE